MESQLKIGHYKRVLFCTDFTKQSNVAFDYAIDAALRNRGSELHLLHIFNEPDAQFWRNYVTPEMEVPFSEQLPQLMDALAERYGKDVPGNVQFRPVVREGEPVESILTYVEEANIDLIVMGRANRSRIATWLLGNVMGRVAAKANCPILIVPVSVEHEKDPEDDE